MMSYSSASRVYMEPSLRAPCCVFTIAWRGEEVLSLSPRASPPPPRTSPTVIVPRILVVRCLILQIPTVTPMLRTLLLGVLVYLDHVRRADADPRARDVSELEPRRPPPALEHALDAHSVRCTHVPRGSVAAHHPVVACDRLFLVRLLLVEVLPDPVHRVYLDCGAAKQNRLRRWESRSPSRQAPRLAGHKQIAPPAVRAQVGRCCRPRSECRMLCSQPELLQTPHPAPISFLDIRASLRRTASLVKGIRASAHGCAAG